MLAVITDPSQDWLLTLFKVVCVFAVVMPMVAYSVVAERRISAWIQDRIGPNRVGIPFTNIKLLGLGQPLADGLKALVKAELRDLAALAVHADFLAARVGLAPAA